MKKKDEIKVCLVGSSGGHLTHLYMLKPFWKDKNRFWVTFDKEDARSLLEGEKVYPCYFPTNRSIKALIKNTKIAWDVLHKEKPDLIISCGAAVAVPFFYIGKMMGAKLVYIEVFDRIDKPTMTGKMVYPRTRLRLVMDLQENVKAQENLAYALKVKISNLQKMAETLVWVQENNINDLTELNDLCKTAQANAQAAYERLSQAQTPLPAYFPYPKFLLQMSLSHTARLTYVLLLDRMTLSQKNGWVDAQGRAYVLYPLAGLAKDLQSSISSVTRALRELEAARLIERRSNGFSKPNQVFLSFPSTAQKCTVEMVKNEQPDCSKVSNTASGLKSMTAKSQNWKRNSEIYRLLQTLIRFWTCTASIGNWKKSLARWSLN